MSDDTPTGGTTVRVTTTPDVILRHAIELTESRRGEDRWQQQARGIAELGYQIIPKPGPDAANEDGRPYCAACGEDDGHAPACPVRADQLEIDRA